MTRKSVFLGLVALLGLLGMPAVAGGADGPVALSALAGQIIEQSEATATATALIENIWATRIAGLGTGLAVGLVGGGLLAYVTRGGNR